MTDTPSYTITGHIPSYVAAGQHFKYSIHTKQYAKYHIAVILICITMNHNLVTNLCISFSGWGVVLSFPLSFSHPLLSPVGVERLSSINEVRRVKKT